MSRIFPSGSRSPFRGGHKYRVGNKIRDYRHGGLEARIRNDGKIFRPHKSIYSMGYTKNDRYYNKRHHKIGHHYGK